MVIRVGAWYELVTPSVFPSDVQQDWDKIFKTLEDWKLDPSHMDDGETDVPTPEIVELAIKVATKLHTLGCGIPMFLVPFDGDIVFEKHDAGGLTEVVSIREDHSIHYRAHLNCNVVVSTMIEL